MLYLMFGDLLICVHAHYELGAHGLCLEVRVFNQTKTLPTCLRELAWPKWTMS